MPAYAGMTNLLFAWRRGIFTIPAEVHHAPGCTAGALATIVGPPATPPRSLL